MRILEHHVRSDVEIQRIGTSAYLELTSLLGSRWSRYLGSASRFDATVGEQIRLSTPGEDLTYYHAKAAAALLMVQLAVELAPDRLAPGGWGMSASEVKIVDSMRQALLDVDEETFFGKMKIVKGTNGGGTSFQRHTLRHMV